MGIYCIDSPAYGVLADLDNIRYGELPLSVCRHMCNTVSWRSQQYECTCICDRVGSTRASLNCTFNLGSPFK